MLGLPPSVSVTKDENVNLPLPLAVTFPDSGPLNPPIITHTAATPAATPQGSPNEASANNKDMKNSLSVVRAFDLSSLSIDSIDKSSSTLSVRSSPKLSLHKDSVRSQRGWLGILKNREDNKSLVDSQSDSGEDGEGDAANNNKAMPRRSSTNNYSDCNGHAPLNNQRTLSPQNSIKSYQTLSPRNSIKSHQSLSRQNSLGSRGCSRQNSFSLSRQNSINSHRTLSPQNSIGSGAGPKEEYKPNNLTGTPDTKNAEDGEREEGTDQDDDRQCPCKFCPEPTGCFYRRRHYPLYIIPPDSLVRRKCRDLIEQKWFDYTVLFFIALNCITLAMERPDIPKKSLERSFLTIANYMFTFIFAFEMGVKVIAAGFVLGHHTYLKSGWNVMDGFLVFISIIDICISLTASSSPRIFGILRVFRLLRTLRPLRVISRAPGLKLVVQTLLSSLRPIGNIVLICCTFFIIFGILGVQLFKGTFFYCDGPDVHDINNKTDCINKGPPFRWVNRKYNFDNLGQALMALFVLASKDGWVNIMYTGLDAVGVDQQPVENYSEWRLFYFISFLLLVGFFVLNMFVGVVVENFHKCRESQEQEERARRAAKRAKKLDKKRRSMGDGISVEDSCDSLSAEMREPPYWSHYSSLRLVIHTVCSSKYFDLAIAGVIGLNVITMAMEFYMMPEELQFALKIFNYFFTSVFILEALVKIIALSFVRYIKDRWNQLDIAIVILSIIGIVLEEMKSNVIPINPTIIRVMRVLRIARVLKLLKMAKGIRALLDTVVQALPQVGNLGLLFFLLFFIFAALGVELFGRLECSEEHPCEGLGKHAHFQNFGIAFLTLFRVATGDNWNGIMKDTLREDCDASENCVRNCCVSPIIAPVFFVVFVLMAQFVLVNVVVAVLMRHLEESHKSMDDDAELEAEIQHELEEEARLKVEQEAAAVREKEDDEDANLDDIPDDEDIIEDADDNPERGLSQENWCDVNAYNESFLDEVSKRRALSKQTSLPPNFCFNVRPPSPDPSCLEGEHYDWRLTPTAIEVALQNELEEREKAASYLDDDYPLTLVVPQLPGHDWPRPEHIPSNGYTLTPPPEVVHPISDDFKPRPRVGGLGYLPRQDAVFQGSSGSIASAISEPLSSRGSCAHLTPTSPGGKNPHQHLHGSVPNLPPPVHPGECMALRHHSQPSLYYTDQTPGSHGATAAASPLVPPPPPPPAEHRYSTHANEYFPTQPPPPAMTLDEPAMQLTTFSISGDYSDDESEEEGSDQDLLNPNTVFAPREDGAPESYHADTGPQEEGDEEPVKQRPSTDSGKVVENQFELAASKVEDQCDAEVQNIVNPPTAALPVTALTSPSLSVGCCSNSNPIATSGPEQPNTFPQAALPRAVLAALTNCSEQEQLTADMITNQNTHTSWDSQIDGDPSRSGENYSQTVPSGSESPTTQHATSPVSTSPITINFTSTASPPATPSPPPYKDVQLYSSDPPTTSPSRTVSVPHIEGPGEMDTESTNATVADSSILPGSSSPSKVNIQPPQSITTQGNSLGLQVGGRESPKTVPGSAASARPIPNAIVINETEQGGVRQLSTVAASLVPLSKPENSLRLRDDEAEDVIVRSTEEYV